MIAYSQQLDLNMKDRKPMVFVVEGPDCMGKTVLAKFIANKLKAAYLHSTAAGALAVAQKDYIQNVLNNVRDTVTLAELDVVLDRCWPSEHCYAPVLRPPGRPITRDGITAVNLPVPMSSDFFSQLQAFNTVYIFCFSANPLEKFKAHQSSPKERAHQYSEQEYVEVYHNYTNLAMRLAKDDVPVSFYSIEEHGATLDTYINDVISLYGKKETQTRPV